MRVVQDEAGRNQTYGTDPEARLWLQKEHHITIIVDGSARRCISLRHHQF